MALYEHVYMARQDVTAQQVEALTEQIKGILAAHGGTIEVESEPGEGATFRFWVPLVEREAAQEE